MPADEVFEDSLLASLYDHFNGWDVCDDFYFGLARTLKNGARVRYIFEREWRTPVCPQFKWMSRTVAPSFVEIENPALFEPRT